KFPPPALKEALLCRLWRLVVGPAEDLGELLLIAVLCRIGRMSLLKLGDRRRDRKQPLANALEDIVAFGAVLFILGSIERRSQPGIIGIDGAGGCLDLLRRRDLANDPSDHLELVGDVSASLFERVDVVRGSFQTMSVIVERRRRARVRRERKHK